MPSIYIDKDTVHLLLTFFPIKQGVNEYTHMKEIFHPSVSNITKDILSVSLQMALLCYYPN